MWCEDLRGGVSFLPVCLLFSATTPARGRQRNEIADMYSANESLFHNKNGQTINIAMQHTAATKQW